MKTLFGILLFTALATTPALACDLVTANKEARAFAALVLNAQLVQHDHAKVTPNEIFAMEVIIDDQVVKVQPVLHTVGALKAALFSSEAFTKLDELTWAVQWTFERNLPSGTKNSDSLSKAFCR